MDAGIACWDSKYHYLVIRPWQADTRIASLVGYPNHPSYPSGHSCFSGASAEALGYFFPAEKDTLWQLAEEASISRLYGGIHYEFDLTAGKEIGRQVGDLMETFAVGQGWSPFTP
jgi:membrane-associated phospholipid phosphatase